MHVRKTNIMALKFPQVKKTKTNENIPLIDFFYKNYSLLQNKNICLKNEV